MPYCVVLPAVTPELPLMRQLRMVLLVAPLEAPWLPSQITLALADVLVLVMTRFRVVVKLNDPSKDRKSVV